MNNTKIRIQGLRIKTCDYNFLGSGWNFLVMENGQAFWIHQKTQVSVKSTR